MSEKKLNGIMLSLISATLFAGAAIEQFRSPAEVLKAPFIETAKQAQILQKTATISSANPKAVLAIDFNKVNADADVAVANKKAANYKDDKGNEQFFLVFGAIAAAAAVYGFRKDHAKPTEALSPAI